MANIKDVAKLASVSISTVSHVINKTRHVSPDTKSRVEAAIAELDYKTNSSARALKGGSLQTIAMLVQRSTNPFFLEVIDGFQEICAREGYALTVSMCGDDEMDQIEQMKFIRHRGADGFAILLERISPGLAAMLKAETTAPVIALDEGEYEGITSFNDNSPQGAALAARHLADIGCDRVLVLGGPDWHGRMVHRVSGFCDAWQAVGKHRNTLTVLHSPLTFDGGKTCIDQHKSQLSHYDGVMAMCDAIAIGAMSMIGQYGLSVPRDISVVGYDNIEMSKFTSPPLTTVSQSAYRFGIASAKAIIAMTKGLPSDEIGPLREPVLVKRGSTASTRL